MGKTVEDLGADTAAAAAELKRQLQGLMRLILEEEDDNACAKAIEEGLRILSSLKQLKSDSLSSSSKAAAAAVAVPGAFRCPLSKKMMTDPVVLSTGQTYDRLHIQRWLDEGNRTCPETKEVLSHTVLTPNHLVQNLIFQWCKEHGIEPPKPASDIDRAVDDTDRSRLNSLLQKMSSSSLSDQKDAAKELRRLTKKVSCFRVLFAESADSITRLLSPLSSGNAINSDPDLQEDLITTVLNLSIPEENKSLVVENTVVIPLLIQSLVHGTMETRRNAAAALFTLSAIDSNKDIIGNANALKPLVDLLDEGDALAVKDAASAIFSLCTVTKNKLRGVSAGVIRVTMKKIKEGVFVDESLSLLALFSGSHVAVDEIMDLGAMPCLICIMRETTCSRTAENCVVILCNICGRDRSKLGMVKEEENANKTLSKLMLNGTERAKRKANWILEKLKRVASLH